MSQSVAQVRHKLILSIFFFPLSSDAENATVKLVPMFQNLSCPFVTMTLNQSHSTPELIIFGFCTFPASMYWLEEN